MSRSLTATPLRALLVVLLLCVLAVRVVVPQGYMWSTGADGVPHIMVCPGMSPMPAMPSTAMAGHHSHGQHDHGQQDHGNKTVDHPCAFAAAGVAVDLAATIHPIATPRLRIIALASPIYDMRPGLGLAAPPPPKTGPPTLA